METEIGRIPGASWTTSELQANEGPVTKEVAAFTGVTHEVELWPPHMGANMHPLTMLNFLGLEWDV